MWWNEKLLKYIIKLLNDHKYLSNALVFSCGNGRERLILSFKYWIVKKLYQENEYLTFGLMNNIDFIIEIIFRHLQDIINILSIIMVGKI